MVARPLDIDGVRAFVLAADLGSFTRSAEALATSQAAISLRIKRLEDRLGCRLLDRTPRHVRLTQRGGDFLASARALLEAHERAVADLAQAPPPRLLLGISDHVAGPDLALTLRRLGLGGGTLVVEVRIAPSHSLMTDFERGEIDAAIVRTEEETPRDGTVLARDRLTWFGAPDFAHRAGEPLRLATLASPCGVRAAATRALDAAGLPWTEVFVGGGVLAVGAAVGAGLAVAALARPVAPAGAIEVAARLGLPELPLSTVVLHDRATDPRARAALRALAAAHRSS